ncbi:exodeoxyribonuclease III [Cryomorphaceae bacterium]|nr:exodeoxyribonuclease III [Cryomorphaceae bacterium]
MKFISFNVNGIRASVKKGLLDSLVEMDADAVCFQETKATPEQVAEALTGLQGYHLHAYSAEKKGYSGTAIISKEAPQSVTYGIGIEEHDQEGRVITAEFDEYYLVTAYVPNSGNGLKRLDYRSQWDADMAAYLERLQEQKPVMFCGDLNVAHQEIDIARPKSNYNKTAGYTQKEIDGMDRFLNQTGLVDTFREQHPEEVKYSWWSYRAGAREKNIGWRLDYFLVSKALMPRISSSFILNEVLGSDHCPVGIEMS